MLQNQNLFQILYRGNEEERKKMCNEGEWGTDIEINIAAIIADRPIIVYKRNHNNGISQLCHSYPHINRIVSGEVFSNVRKYLTDPFYNQVAQRIYCVYLPDSDTSAEPLLLYNIDQGHYRALLPRYGLSGYNMRHLALRKSRGNRKISRKSRGNRKNSRKSRGNKKSSRKSKGKGNRKSSRNKKL